MVKAELILEGGLLKSCRISGHAGAGPKGGDIVCAAVSVLSRTAFKILSEREGIEVEGGAPNRGEFWLEISGHGPENTEFLAGTGTFLKEGLFSVSGEFPDFCQVIVVEEK